MHPRNLWVKGSNLTGGSQLAKLPLDAALTTLNLALFGGVSC